MASSEPLQKVLSGRKRACADEECVPQGIKTDAIQEVSDKGEATKQLVLKIVRNVDEEILLEALDQLCDCINNDPRRRSRRYGPRFITSADMFVQTGGHLGVVGTMKEFPQNKLIQLNGMRVFTTVTGLNKDAGTSVATVGGMQVIIDAMRMFPDNAEITSNGFKALATIVRDDEDNKVSLVAQIDFIPFIVKMMDEFKMDEDVISQACKLLHELCISENLRKAIFNGNAVTALAAVIDGHKDDKVHSEICSGGNEVLVGIDNREVNHFCFVGRSCAKLIYDATVFTPISAKVTSLLMDEYVDHPIPSLLFH